MYRPNKLECLPLASLFSLKKCFQARPEPAQVELQSGAGFWPKPNIRPGCKGLQGTNGLAYLASLPVTEKKGLKQRYLVGQWGRP